MEPATIIQARKELQAPKMVRKALLICGILSPLLYVGADILAGILYAGYSFTSQAISELFAIGAPTSGLVVPLFTVSSVLLVAFALGVWMSAGWNHALRAMALMMVGNAVNVLVFIFVLLALGFGTAAYRNWFRFYTIGTILTLFLTGLMAFLYAPEVSANLPTPWLGLMERISTYVYDLWQVVLAIILLQEERRPGAFR